MASDRKLFVKILYLNCFITDELGFDELYLKLDGEKIWPPDHKYQQVKAGRTKVNINIKNLNPKTKLDLEIWDYDYFSADDLLGKVMVIADEPGGPFTTDMIPNFSETQKAKYSIDWEIDYEE
jgi:hypothetical protein